MEPPDSVNKSGFGPIPKDPRTMCKAGSAFSVDDLKCTGTANGGDYYDGSNPNNLSNMSLPGLFRYYEVDNDGNVLVDYQKDARTDPSTFNPLCNIKGTLVMRGGGCLVDFGWYCADGSKDPVIHPLVTSDDIVAYATAKNPPYPSSWVNKDNGFLPKTGYKIDGTPLRDVANDPNFKTCKTKKIGFAIIGNGTKNCSKGGAACACTQNKYTQRELNQVASASGGHYIAAVMFASKVTPGKFYIGMEDLPTSEKQFDAPYVHKDDSGQTITWNADGDFNDFVYTVEGVVCQGGGQLCTVPGQQGICATGVTSCVTDANKTASCDPVFKPLKETCNAIDDDCNGTVDDGDELCESGLTCYHGTCVADCATVGEFVCPDGQVCLGHICVDGDCAAANCKDDQRCVGGKCVGGCDGVICNAGEQCVGGKCVDLCDARTEAGLDACPENFVCQNGACVPNCTCLSCPSADQECQSDANQPKTFGRCVASGCSDGHCGDNLCVPGGDCISPCNPNPCGADQTCTPAKVYNPANDRDHQYSCTNPSDPNNNGGASNAGGTSSISLDNRSGSGNNNHNTNGNSSTGSSSGDMGCGCRMQSAPRYAWGLIALSGLTLLGARRRRS